MSVKEINNILKTFDKLIQIANENHHIPGQVFEDLVFLKKMVQDYFQKEGK
jgi:hypothetical protein